MLVADDSPTALHILSRLLGSEQGIEVVATAQDGRQALEQAEAQRPDLVVIDFEMPNMNGLEATAQLRRSFPGIGIIMVSVHEGTEMRRAAEDSGADAFVPKNRLSQLLSDEIRRVMKPA